VVEEQRKTTGIKEEIISTLKGCQKIVRRFWHPSGVRTFYSLKPGGLRCAATTGYSLATLRVAAAALNDHDTENL